MRKALCIMALVGMLALNVSVAKAGLFKKLDPCDGIPPLTACTDAGRVGDAPTPDVAPTPDPDSEPSCPENGDGHGDGDPSPDPTGGGLR